MSEQTSIVLRTGGDFLIPAAPLETMIATYQAKKDFIAHVLAEGVDFGKIPGAGDKPALFKAGAEKMTSFFGLAPIFEDVQTVEDWTGADHNGELFFFYRQKCKLFRGERLIGSADGSANSFEKKYRYRWVQENEVPSHMDKSKLKVRGGKVSEFSFALDKAETTGQYGKPAEYWKRFKDALANGSATRIMRKTKSGKEMEAIEIDSTLYQIPNDDVAEQVNTILKMAQKRALVAAVLIATNISDYFTQDIEDYTSLQIIDAVVTEVAAPVITVSKPAATVKPATVREAEIINELIPEEKPVQIAKPIRFTPASIRLAKIGGTNGHGYPAVWVKDMMVKIVGAGKCNEFELDGILQKLDMEPTTTPEIAVGAVESYLNAKAAGEDPEGAARDFIAAVK